MDVSALIRARVTLPSMTLMRPTLSRLMNMKPAINPRHMPVVPTIVTCASPALLQSQLCMDRMLCVLLQHHCHVITSSLALGHGFHSSVAMAAAAELRSALDARSAEASLYRKQYESLCCKLDSLEEQQRQASVAARAKVPPSP